MSDHEDTTVTTAPPAISGSSFVNTMPRGAGLQTTSKQETSHIPGSHFHASTPNYSPSHERVVHILKEESIRSWNLKFTGESDVVDFFLRIDDFRRSRDVSEYKVIKCFADLLGGKALDYYRQIRDNTITLADLSYKFKQFFTPIDNDFILERSIRDHKQMPGQSLGLYVLEMQTMNARLADPLGEAHLIDIVKHNMLPTYAHLLALYDIVDLEQLISLGKRFEAYSLQPFQSNTAVHKQPKPYTQKVAIVHSKAQQKRADPVNCLKCKKLGHSYRECRTIPGIVCFQCGEKGFLSSNCPKCHPPTQKPRPFFQHNQKN